MVHERASNATSAAGKVCADGMGRAKTNATGTNHILERQEVELCLGITPSMLWLRAAPLGLHRAASLQRRKLRGGEREGERSGLCLQLAEPLLGLHSNLQGRRREGERAGRTPNSRVRIKSHKKNEGKAAMEIDGLRDAGKNEGGTAARMSEDGRVALKSEGECTNLTRKVVSKALLNESFRLGQCPPPSPFLSLHRTTAFRSSLLLLPLACCLSRFTLHRGT